MAIDIAVHALGTMLHGALAPAPLLPALDQQAGLALDTVSDVFTVTAPAVIAVVSDARARVDLTASAGTPDPATSGVVLEIKVPRFFQVDAGSWKLEATAYA